MIEITVSIEEKINGCIRVKTAGHSGKNEVCNSISILMNLLQSAFYRTDENSYIFRPEPGIFELKAGYNNLLSFTVLCFLDSVRWLKTQYADEISIDFNSV